MSDVNTNPNDNDGQKQDGAVDENKAVEIYRPEGLPDHFMGKDEKETLDKVFKAYTGARSELAGKKNIPEKIDDYKLELPEEISKAIIKPGEDGKDPVWEHMRGLFHKRGIGAEDAVAIVQEFVSSLPGFGAEANADDAGLADFEFKSFGGQDKAKPHIDGAMVFLDGLKNSQKLSEKAVEELKLLTAHGEGLAALNELRPLLGDKAIPAKIDGKESGEDDVSEEGLSEMMRDPKYWRDQDPAYIKKVTEGFQKLYGQKGA